MATPRKHWFRVFDSILHETWPIELKGVAVNLMAYLNTRWARDGLTAEQACSARLSPAACMLVTGSQRLVKARSTLGRLAVETQLSVTYDGADTVIRWPKFSEMQGFATLKKPESRPRVAPSAPSPAPSPAPALTDTDTEAAAPRVCHGTGAQHPEPERRVPASSRPPPAPRAIEQAALLRDAVRRRWPQASVPQSLVAWAREVERVQAPPEQVAELIAWLVDPRRDTERYVPEVRCARSFRAKWNALVAARTRSERGAPKSAAQERYERTVAAAEGALELLRQSH